MRRLGLLVLAVPFSATIAHAQYPFANGNLNSATMETAAKTAGCNVLINQALNQNKIYGEVPFSIVDGKVNVFDQDRFISKTTTGDTETIEYKAPVVTYKDGKAVTETVRKTVIIKRSNGKVVSISHPEDLKRGAASRDAMKKMAGDKFQNYDLLKTSETTFKDNNDGRCETNQKQYVFAKDEKGKVSNTLVTYDAELCNKLQPAIAKIGKNNAAECGPLFATVESAINDRAKSMKTDGKTLSAGGFSLGTGQVGMDASTFSISMAISNCLQEDQIASGMYNNGMGGMPGYGMGNLGYGYGMGGGMIMNKADSSKDVQSPGKKALEKQGTR